MINKLSQYILKSGLLLAGLMTCQASLAQLHENISVEGKYVPDIIKADRVNIFPKPVRQTLLSSPIEYEKKGVAASFAPSLLTMPATTWGASRVISDNPGYVELGAGSWLNSTLSAGYRFVDNANTLFGIRLQHNSTSLWKPELSEATADVKQFRYDESIGFYGTRMFSGLGRLDAAIDYHFGKFDYYGISCPGVSSGEKVGAPTQTIDDVAFRIDWNSLLRADNSFSYNAALRVRHFGFRSLPLAYLNQGYSYGKGGRETEIEILGGVKLPWENGSSVGMDGKLSLFAERGGIQDLNIGGYSIFSLKPYYRFSRGMLDVSLGADIDLAFKAGPEGDRYPLVHVAPEAVFGVQSGKVGVFLRATGGTTPTTLSYLHELDYYTAPYLVSTRPMFSPVDASFGVNLGPFSGFSLGVEAAYKVMKNAPLGGWYQNNLSGIFADSNRYDFVDNGGNNVSEINLHGYTIGGRMQYEYGKFFSFLVEGSVQPQDGEKGVFNGYDRAKIVGSAQASCSPIAPLNMTLGYHFRGKRGIYNGTFTIPPGGVVIDGAEPVYTRHPLPDLCYLNFAASWSFSKDFSVWMQADNLIGSKKEILPNQPTQGMNVLLGCKWLF